MGSRARTRTLTLTWNSTTESVDELDRRVMEVNGLVSFGAKKSCEMKYPMGLTDIYTYNSWIVGVVKKYNEKKLSEISSFVPLP